MKRINRIIKHKLYLEYVEKIKAYERDREFCKHDMVHFLDVCRLAEIIWLNDRIARIEGNDVNSLPSHETKIQGSDTDRMPSYEIKIESSDAKRQPAYESLDGCGRELIYASGLLHDIGRWQEYEKGIRHEIASAELAPEILKECGFTDAEIEKIVFAILNHRNKAMSKETTLAGFIYQADKKSRPCFCCEAEHKCDWSVKKKNLEIC